MRWLRLGEGHQAEVGAVVLDPALLAVPDIALGLLGLDIGIGQVIGDTLVGSISQSYSLVPVWFLSAAVLAPPTSPLISPG